MIKPSKEGRRWVDLDLSNADASGTEAVQKDMLARLEKAGHDPVSYAGLAYCGLQKCGRVGCLEACWFGTHRRLRLELRSIHKLLSAGETLCEVRVIPSQWTKAIGELSTFEIAAAMQLNSRALNSLYMPTLVAVGNVKVAVTQPSNTVKFGDRLWRYELHLIVTLDDEVKLTKAFSRIRERGAFLNKIWIQRVYDLQECIARVFRRDLVAWEKPGLQPWQEKPEPMRPTKAEQTEFYEWLLGLEVGARTIRYGCDRYFNQLRKKPRTRPARKRRGYPYHLKPYMFGYDPDDDPEVCWLGEFKPGSRR
jgi:hypothetical protein